MTHLFFADDAMLFCEPNKEALLNLRCVMLGFKVVSKLYINMTKFKLVRLEERRIMRDWLVF